MKDYSFIWGLMAKGKGRSPLANGQKKAFYAAIVVLVEELKARTMELWQSGKRKHGTKEQF